MRIRSWTKEAQASGECGGMSHFILGQRMLGVKREPTGLEIRSQYGTLETILSQYKLCEKMIETGSKQMPWVMPRIDHLVNPRGCRLPNTLFLEDLNVEICP